MIRTFQLLRNVGQFDNDNTGAQHPLQSLTLIYAENGRGKTTLAAILRSLATGVASLVSERHRLTATSPPHIIIGVAGAPAQCRFENGAWTSTLPNLAIFDDAFVAQNVCSGIEIANEHRQNLHELILGARGVALNLALTRHIARIEEHNRRLRTLTEAIPATTRGTLTVEAFCGLDPHPDIEAAIEQAKRDLEAAQSADRVRRQPEFLNLALPAFDVGAVNKILHRDLKALEATAVERVHAHLVALGDGAENWVGEGMRRIGAASAAHDHEVCPFCVQDLRGASIITHYRAYFSEAYEELKNEISQQVEEIETNHGGEVQAAFERTVRVIGQNREFWQRFAKVPEFELDTATITRSWIAARKAVGDALRRKQAAPLEQTTLSADALAAVDAYHSLLANVANVSNTLMTVNNEIALVKERAAAANVATMTSDLTRLNAIAARHSPAIGPHCQAYLDEKAAKGVTEELRDRARADLDHYRQTIFPAYEGAINAYLGRFNAGFRIGQVESVNNRGGSSCSYNVVIDDIPVALSGPVGQPTFRSTLSAGDRNTLALAFFFASLDQDQLQAQKIVVIDDPMTSLDEHRSLTTVQEMRRLAARVSQLIVLSHSKPFLFAVWDGADRGPRTAIKLIRGVSGSAFAGWDVNRDCITEHDRRHALVAQYIRGSNQTIDERTVAAALRPILECFMRVAYPDEFTPGALLGVFITKCDRRRGTPTAILADQDIAELRDILDYANRFHHDTNAAWETAIINDQELLDFSRRTLRFAKRT